MSKARITIIELEGLDVDSEFGLMRTLRDLLERTGGTVVASVESVAPAPVPAEPGTVIDAEFPEVDEPEATPAPAAARRPRARTQEEIEELILESLRLEPAIDMQVLASAAYGAEDKRSRTKLTWTLKGMAGRGLVERLSATTWRVLDDIERDSGNNDTDGDGGGNESGDDEEQGD